MKKLLLTLALVLMPLMARADTININDIVSKFPALNQDIFYSFTNQQVQYASSATIVSLFNTANNPDGIIHLDLGYTPASEIIGLVSLKLIDLGKWIQFPIAKYIICEPFVCVGATNLIGDSQKKFDYGVGVKIISIKF